MDDAERRRRRRALSASGPTFAILRAAVCLSALMGGACTAANEPRDAASEPNPPIAPTGSRGLSPPEGHGLLPVALPDFSLMAEPVSAQMQARLASLTGRIEDAAAPVDALGVAYGEMGMLLMAATHFDAAESCYLNAQALAPNDRRWPYLLGHLYKVKGPLGQSVASFERALQLQPTDVATLVSLGEVHLTEGRHDAADPLFQKALTVQVDSAAARVGAGRVALARGDHAQAVRILEMALSVDPQATSIHYPLAMAYRGLGDLEQARVHLARHGEGEARPEDPLMRELDELLLSPEAYDVRGGAALDVGNWALAADYFRRGLDLAPDNVSLRHRLGTALSQLGDARGAEEQFDRVVRTSPEHTRAQFSLGVLMTDFGRYDDAIARFSIALEHDPGYLQARLQLAAALARHSRPEEALGHYERVLEMDPTRVEAALGGAMALVRLRRFEEARDRLSDATATYPDQPVFAHALARVLAAAPDDRVRDGQRARVLVEALLEQDQSVELGETIAMTLAENGEYAQAAAVQRDVMAAAEQAGLPAVVQRMRANLRLYERGEPCRTPWSEDELP